MSVSDVTAQGTRRSDIQEEDRDFVAERCIVHSDDTIERNGRSRRSEGSVTDAIDRLHAFEESLVDFHASEMFAERP